MGLKLGQKLNFRPFLGFCSIFGRDINSGRDIKSGRDINSGRDIKSGRDINSGRDIKFWTATGFSSLTCRGHNFFVLTRIWAREYSLESSLNVECSHEGILTILCSIWYIKIHLSSGAL